MGEVSLEGRKMNREMWNIADFCCVVDFSLLHCTSEFKQHDGTESQSDEAK